MSTYFSQIYNSSLSLLTDFYQLTMAYGYWKSNSDQKESVFHVYFRKNPFKGGYTIAAGLELIIEYLQNFKFSQDDINYLSSLKNSDGSNIFEEDFLKYLSNMTFTCDVHAVSEGTAVFPNEPIFRIKGPLIQCQLLETPILNIINFHSLIATKASRICNIAGDSPVLEFGLRRAQGFDGGLSASRAAFIGGCVGTSNTLAGKIFDIPVKGTHSHSWVMSFENEDDSFFELAKAMPANTVFLVDTYDTIEGVKKAIKVGEWLKNQGKKLSGIRLDSGDLAYLSIESRKLLDSAGFKETMIIASNDLNEHVIASLKEQNACIASWGVGTQLVTAFDEPALGAVYKLTALKDSNDNWSHKIKVSNQTIKTSTPGILQVKRYFNKEQFLVDMIYDELTPLSEVPHTIIDPQDITRFCQSPENTNSYNLLQEIFHLGKLKYNKPSLIEIQQNTKNQLNMLHSGIKRLLNPHFYPAGLEKNLHDLKIDLIYKIKEKNC